MSPQLNFPISKDGLALDIQIGLPAPELVNALATGRPFCPAVTVRALIDTGADATSIAPAALTPLGLVSSGQAQMATAGGTVTVDWWVPNFHSAGAKIMKDKFEAANPTIKLNQIETVSNGLYQKIYTALQGSDQVWPVFGLMT